MTGCPRRPLVLISVGILLVVLLSASGLSPRAQAFWPPLQDVQAWVDGSADSTIVRYRVYDPKLGASREGQASYNAVAPDWWTIGDLAVQDGTVTWLASKPVVGTVTAKEVNCAVYDPGRGSWQRSFTFYDGNSTDSWGISDFKSRGGVVTWLAGKPVVGTISAQQVNYAVYDPERGAWRRSFTFYDGNSIEWWGIGDFKSHSGLVAWLASKPVVDTITAKEIKYAIYDPGRGDWQTGKKEYPAAGYHWWNLSPIAIENQAINWIAEHMENGVVTQTEVVARGYDSSTGAWYSGPTKPLAYIAAQPTSGPPPLWVWFQDMSLGATGWNWKFGDVAVSSTRSPSHTFTVPGNYTVTQTVSGPAGNNSLSRTISVGGAISGTVAGADGVTPVAGASVIVETMGSYAVAGKGTTLADGSYTVGGLATGQYVVHAYKTGYERKYYNGVYGRDDAAPVAVTSPETTPNINLSLGPGGAFSGTVRNADGSAVLANMQVSASPTDGSVFGMGATTGSDGTYTITGLPFKTYKVWAGRGELFGGDSRYVREYYNNKAVNQPPDPVTVAPGTNPTGIDFTLAIGGSISGRITREDGTTPVAGAWVRAIMANSWEWVNDAFTAADGTYTITGIPSGQFLVSAGAAGRETKYYNNVHYRTAASPVPVTSPGDTPGINFALGPGGTISGIVTGSGPLGNITVSTRPNSWLGARGATTASDGSYTLSGLPYGDYKVWAGGPHSDPAARYSSTYYQDKTSWSTANRVTLSAGSADVTGINLGLIRPAGSISGNVTYAGNAPGSRNLYVGAVTKLAPPLFAPPVPFTGPGTYSYTIPYLADGPYVLFAWLDADNSGPGLPSPGDPFGLTTEPTLVAGGAVTGQDFSLTDPSGLINGSVSYAGNVAGSHKIYVRLHPQSPWGNPRMGLYPVAVNSPGGVFNFAQVPDGRYYVSAYLDANDNGEWDATDPTGILGGERPRLLEISGGQARRGLALTIRDPGVINGTVSYSGAVPTPGDYRVWVMALQYWGPFRDYAFAAYRRGPGSYSLTLPPGRYILLAYLDTSWDSTLTGGEPWGVFGDATVVSVPDGPVNNIDVTLSDTSRGLLVGGVGLESRRDHAGTPVNVSGSVSKALTTLEDGEFVAVLPAGAGYNVTAARGGFLPLRISGVQVFDLGSSATRLKRVVLLAGNADNTENIDALDLAAVAAAFNSSPPSNSDADFNGDNIVDVFDLFWIGKNFGRGPETPPVAAETTGPVSAAAYAGSDTTDRATK